MKAKFFSVPIYDSHVYHFRGKNPPGIAELKWLERHGKIKFREEVRQAFLATSDRFRAWHIRMAASYHAIWTQDDSASVHELTHCAMSVLGACGIQIDHDNHEALAYLLEFLHRTDSETPWKNIGDRR